jgi:hypothetical protein
MKDLNKKIKDRLDYYLEFDSDELFQCGDFIKVFGGAVRDSISEMEINDVDILCAPNSHKRLSNLLLEKGYKLNDYLCGKHLTEMYKSVNNISEPHTFIKGDKIIQLIRPRFNNQLDIDFREVFNRLVQNVDISCCGVSYDKMGLKEEYKNAILHCQNLVFSKNLSGSMYDYNRWIHRSIKLEKRGWKEIEDTTSNNRDLKIQNIIDEW